METKEKLYISAIIILLVLLLFTNLEFKKAVPKERQEIYKTNCEHWEICDYFEDYLCYSINCPLRYQCTIIDKNCKENIIKVE